MTLHRDLQQRMQIDNADSPTSLRRWSNAYLMMARVRARSHGTDLQD